MQTRADDTGEGAPPGNPAPSRAATGDLPRFDGPRADIAHYSGRLLDAQAAGDTKRERDVSIALAHLYTQRGTNLDAAVALARRAISLGDDAALRSELAGWLAGLGDAVAAALELRGTQSSPGTTDRNRVKTLVQAGVLLARAQRADAAAQVFDEAAELDPEDPIPRELAGMLSTWAEHVIPRPDGARAYVQAAERRAKMGDDEAALEDLLRAFELCPSSGDAARAAARALETEGRALAADEILRDHAAALEMEGDAAQATEVHASRLTRALEGDDVGLALSAALDLGLAATLPRPELEARVDDVIARAGLHDLVAARLEQRGWERNGPGRAIVFDTLARLHASGATVENQSVHAWIEAALADPAQAAPLDALRDRAEKTEDRVPLVEALVRIVEKDRTELPAPRSVLARLALELASLAEDTIGDPRLADWAFDRARAFDPVHADAAASAHARLEPALAEREAEITKAEAALDGSSPSAEAAWKLVRLLGQSPPSEERAFAALAALVRAEPWDEDAARLLRMLFERSPTAVTRSELYESVLRARLGKGPTRRQQVRLRLELAFLVRSDASGRRPLDELLPLLDHADLDAGGASHILVAALAAGSARDEAQSLVALSAGAERHTAALLLAAAADAHRRAGNLGEARKVAERALDLDPACSRAASSLARVAAAAGGRDAAVAIERALGLIVPRAWLCDALARSLEGIGETDLAFAWTHRWLALAPGDRRAISELLRRCQLGTDARRVADALSWVLAQPDPPAERADLLIDALALLYGLDRTKGGQVARRTLDVLGPTQLVRERFSALADEHNDAGLAIALYERAVAADPSAPRELLLELANRRAGVGDFDGAAQELLRAVGTDLDPGLLLETADEIEKTAQAESRATGTPSALGPDGSMALAEVRARVLAGLLEAAAPERGRAVTRTLVAEAWRLLGAMRWDLAQDPRGSELALFSAAEAAGDQAAFELYARDLCELAGAEKGVAALFERLGSLSEAPPAERVALAMAAGSIAAEHGLANWALDGALAVLAVEPSNADAISLAESQAPHVDGGEAAIDHIYEALAKSALGMFGRRAAHYRAARQLERLGGRELALKHALKAFEAVPTEGTSWTVLTRLVDPVRGSAEAVEIFQRVASKARGDEKVGWVRRALELSGSDRAGLERRFDILLRALVATPDAALVTSLADVVERLTEEGGLPDGAQQRLAQTTNDILPTLEGPDGARTAAHLARVLCDAGTEKGEPTADESFHESAFRALSKAVEIDGEVEVFDRIAPSASKFGLFSERASIFVAHVIERMGNKHALVGPPLLRFASAIADSLGDSRSSAELLDEAERRDASDPTSSAKGEAPRHEDPFSDPSFLESRPPPPAFPTEPEPEPEPAVEPAPPKRKPRLEVLESDPPPPMPPGVEALADLLEDSVAPPRPVPAPRKSSSGSFPGVRGQSPELSPIKDGFDALFDDAEERASEEELEAREAEARERGDHEAVSELLLQRIVTSTWTDQVRVLKLRRAAVLEQRLSRVDDARRELLDLLDENPNDKSALSFLADLLEKRGEHKEAAPLYERLSNISEESDESRRSYALASAKSHLGAGDAAAALKVLDALQPPIANLEVTRARIEILRTGGDTFSLVLALDQLVASGDLPDEEAAKLLIEASRAAGSGGDQQGALIRARRAARLVPNMPEAVLECVALEYRNRGTGTPREAQAVLDALQSISGGLPPEHVELHTFLLAETIDVIHGGGAGLRELSHRHAEVGPLPLIALGMAERLARSRSFEASVPLFGQALEGDLRGLRNKARVALAATDAAIQAGHLAEARGFLEEAESVAELRAQVERRRREIIAFDDDPAVARPVLTELLAESTGLVRARVLQRLARFTVDTDFERSVALYEEALVLARRDRNMADKIRTEILEILESRGLGKLDAASAASKDTTPVSKPEPPATAPDSSARPAIVPEDISGSGSLAEQSTTTSLSGSQDVAPTPEPTPTSPEAAEVAAPAVEEEEKPPSDRDSGESLEVQPEWIEEGRLSPAPSSRPTPLPHSRTAASPPPPAPLPAPPPPLEHQRDRERVEPLGPLAPPARPLFLNSREETLFEQLLDGYLDAGDALVESYDAMQDARSRDVLVVRRHQVALKPGVRKSIEALRDAALAERDEVYARALDHVLGMDSPSSVKPPPLFAQPREPEFLSALLYRDVSSRETEVLSIVWEAGMFRKELASYSVGGPDRVPLTAASVLGEAYSEIAAVLGAPRPLFHRRSDAPLELGVALVAQPAIVAGGEVKTKSAELMHRLAAIHASAAPELVLAAHLDEPTLARLFEAMMAAFGPVRPPTDDAPGSSSASFRAEVTRITGELWQRINPRAERRLRDLCEIGSLDPVVARTTAQKAMRRAGLFASGDLALSLKLLAQEEGQQDLSATSANNLELACEVSPEVADLVRLATRMEYAEVRWQMPSPASIRR